MKQPRILEVCTYNVQSCIIAEKAGAARVELCDNPMDGGTTPSYGAIQVARDKISIPIYPIIRPRGGNFLYNDEEFEIIRQDIRMCRELGCNGVSTGVQRIDGTIDTDRLARIVEWAGPLGVTCHRVFDVTPDPFQALEDIISCGCERILTSGQAAAAPKGADLLARLVEQAGDRIVIMPGAGVKSANIEDLINKTGAREYHAAAKQVVPNPVRYLNPEVNDYGEAYLTSETEIRALVGVLNNH